MLKKARITIQELIKKYSNVEVELLLSHVLGKTREFFDYAAVDAVAWVA
jgi:hypothetical protein